MNGQTFKGLGFTAYNKATKKYESVWMDSMSTGIGFSNGTETEPGTWTYKGSFFGPGGRKCTTRMVMMKISDDEEKMEMFCDMGMGEQKSMELTATREK
jgi:hypothetical protein